MPTFLTGHAESCRHYVHERIRVLALLAFALVWGAGCSSDQAGPSGVPTVPRDSLISTQARRWSDPGTWASQRVPTEGENVTIPAGQVVVLDVAPPPLGRLVIAGELQLPNVARQLIVSRIEVLGALTAGTEQTPITQSVTVTLRGRDSSAGDFFGPRAFVVNKGARLELHGALQEDWVHLSGTVQAGQATIRVDQPVTWAAGAHLVLAPSGFDPADAEEVIIASVSPDRTTLTLAQPLRARHFGEIQQIDGRTLDERAEVGLLTRPLVVQGDVSAEQDGQGGHVIVLMGGVAHVEGVEFLRMGQRGVLARYALHWHMAGDVPGQYARHNSIVHSYNRCLTIHGTNVLEVRRNVCYDFLGHGFFLEDGAETRNTLAENLAVGGTIPALAARLLPTDGRPASFWITNPDNRVVGNVATGTQGIGYWYALPLHPTGLSANPSIWPRYTPLGQFAGNVAHSNTEAALFVDDGPNAALAAETANYSPLIGATESGAYITARFTGLVAYKHPDRAVWMRGAYLSLEDAVLADNGIGATLASYQSNVSRTWFVGTSANGDAGTPPDSWIRGFEFYDGPIALDRALFSAYTARGTIRSSALALHTPNGFSLSPDNRASALTFAGTTARVSFAAATPGLDGEQTGIIRDLDGTITGVAGRVVVPDSAFMRGASCERHPEWNVAFCSGGYTGISLTSARNERVAPVQVQREDGPMLALAGVPDAPTEVEINVPLDHVYTFTRSTGLPRSPRVTVGPLRSQERVTFVFQNVGMPTALALNDGVPGSLSLVQSAAALAAQARTAAWYDAVTRRLTVRVSGADGATVVVGAELP